jgi:hypothetical protein
VNGPAEREAQYDGEHAQHAHSPQGRTGTAADEPAQYRYGDTSTQRENPLELPAPPLNDLRAGRQAKLDVHRVIGGELEAHSKRGQRLDGLGHVHFPIVTSTSRSADRP